MCSEAGAVVRILFGPPALAGEAADTASAAAACRYWDQGYLQCSLELKSLRGLPLWLSW